MDGPAPLIVTLKLDERSFAFFEAERQRYFPPERNFIPAHLTLFHHLPGAELPKVLSDIEAESQAQAPFSLNVPGLVFLGRGVAYRLESDALAKLRQNLARRWAPWLTPQDRQATRPHVTIQNKVDPQQARQLLSELESRFTPFEAQAEGLLLWRYLGGPWDAAGHFPFTA